MLTEARLVGFSHRVGFTDGSPQGFRSVFPRQSNFPLLYTNMAAVKAELGDFNDGSVLGNCTQIALYYYYYYSTQDLHLLGSFFFLSFQ